MLTVDQIDAGVDAGAGFVVSPVVMVGAPRAAPTARLNPNVNGDLR